MKDSTESKEGTVNKTLKKLKLDSDKDSFISNKDPLSDSEANEKEKTLQIAEEPEKIENEKSKQKKPSISF